MKKRLKYAGAGLAVALLVAQFHRPVMDNPREDGAATLAARLAPPGSVQQILERACADCHSNRTSWPWYSAVAPASWLVAQDVREGRAHLNFSEWGTYRRARQITALNMIISVVDRGEMPPVQYTLLHRGAALTGHDKETLLDWAEAAADSLTNESSNN